MFKQSTGGAVTTLLAAFLAGGLVAWGLSARLLGSHRDEWRGIGALGPGRPGGAAGPGGRRVLGHALGLSATQQDSVQAIFERHRPQMEALWREMRPRFDSLRVTVDSEIARQLTPAQRARFAELTKRLDSRLRGVHDAERR